ncbi:MAG: hypothetical protein E2O76_05170 [Caldithrix sp.]|nr:MAG: hypothetical protein E2O76_05170 [Caldithrix sp.]
MINRISFILALLGVLLTIHLWIQKQRSFDQGCLGFSRPEIQQTISSECQEVMESEAATLFGFDNIILGFLFYVSVGGLCLGTVFSSDKNRARLQQATLGLTGLGFVFTLYFIYVQIFVLKTFCVLCMTSAVLIIMLFGLQVFRIIKKIAPETLQEPGKVVRELGWFTLISFFAGALLLTDLIFVNKLGTASLLRPPHSSEIRQVANEVLNERIDQQFLTAMAPCSYDDSTPPVENWRELISQTEPYIGDPEAAVTIIKFFDPNCSHCRQLHPVLKNVAAKYQDKAKFYFKPFPLWNYSIAQIEALWLAADQKKYFEMIELQFATQQPGGLPEAKLRELAASLKLDLQPFDEGLQNGKYSQKVLSDKKRINQCGINSAPKILLNGKFVGSKGQTITESCLGKLIEQELDRFNENPEK